jgi:titin
MSLSAGSNAIDAGIVLPNVNDSFSGSAPDLGALEQGGGTPIYGVRLEGVDESNQTPLPPTTVSLPAAPMSLTATVASSTQINLNWTDSSANEDGFRVERCQGIGCTNFVQIAQLLANATTYADTALAASSAYTYRVRAHNSTGVSDYSNTASDTTQTPPPMPPAAPSNLVGSAAATQINLQWTDNSNNETGFIIERSTDGITFTVIFTTDSNVTRYSNDGLTANTFYHYRVRAYNGARTSANSNVIKVKTKSR